MMTSAVCFADVVLLVSQSSTDINKMSDQLGAEAKNYGLRLNLGRFIGHLNRDQEFRINWFGLRSLDYENLWSLFFLIVNHFKF